MYFSNIATFFAVFFFLCGENVSDLDFSDLYLLCEPFLQSQLESKPISILAVLKPVNPGRPAEVGGVHGIVIHTSRICVRE